MSPVCTAIGMVAALVKANNAIARYKCLVVRDILSASMPLCAVSLLVTNIRLICYNAIPLKEADVTQAVSSINWEE